MQRLDDLADLALQLVASDGFAVAGAILGLAEVVGVRAVATLRVTTAQGRAAVGTGDKATQGEVLADILAHAEFYRTVEAALNLVKQIDGNQRRVMAFQPVNPVNLATNMTGIERVVQHIGNTLIGDDTFSVAWKVGIEFEVPPHFDLRAKAPRGEALKGFAHCLGKRCMLHEHLATASDGLVPIADWCRMHPIAGLHPRLHFLRDLASVLLALQRALGGHNGFDKLAFRRLVKGEVKAFDTRAARAERVAQVKMKARIAGETLQVVKDDDVIPVRHRVEIAEKRDHAGALHEVTATGDRIGEDCLHLISLEPSIVATSGFL